MTGVSVLGPRQLKEQHYCQLSSLSMEMDRTAKYFGGQYSHDIRGHRFRMQFIQCNNWLDVVHVFAFFWGERLWWPWYNFFYVRRGKGQHYINTVIEYGHFRLKIGGISRLTLSQRESSHCSELYCSQLPTFSNSSMINCLFGDVVRFYFIVLRLRPTCSASRWSMTVPAKQTMPSAPCRLRT